MSRFYTLPTPKPIEEVRQKLQSLLPNDRCGDFTEALMELGALVCRPKNPDCHSCPLAVDCKAFNEGEIEKYPLKTLKKMLPTRYTTAYIVKRKDGAILLRKRVPQGLLGGMMEVPTTSWDSEKHESHQTKVKHTFTHFHLEIDVCHKKKASDFEGIWVLEKDLKKYALPTVMKKILRKAKLESVQNSFDGERLLPES